MGALSVLWRSGGGSAAGIEAPCLLGVASDATLPEFGACLFFSDELAMDDLLAASRALAAERRARLAAERRLEGSEKKAEAAVDAWIGPRLAVVEGVRASVDEIEASGSGWTFAKLTIANGAIREVLGS